MEAQSRGLAASVVKPRIMWRMESVERMVVTPSRAASRLARVLFPVPLVPASSTVTLRACSRILHQPDKAQMDGEAAQLKRMVLSRRQRPDKACRLPLTQHSAGKEMVDMLCAVPLPWRESLAAFYACRCISALHVKAALPALLRDLL